MEKKERVKREYIILYTVIPIIVFLYTPLKTLPVLSAVLCIIFSALTISGLIFLKQCSDKKLKSRIFRLFCLALGCLFATVAANNPIIVESGRFCGVPMDTVITVKGTVTKDPVKIKDDLYIFFMDIHGVENNRKITTQAYLRINVFVNNPNTAWGETLTVHGKIQKRIKNGGVEYSLFARDGDIKKDGWSHDIFQTRMIIRRNILDAIDSMGFSAGSALFRALFLGVKDDLDDNIIEDFRSAGIIHVLALSGMHVGIIAGCLGFFLSRLIGFKGSLVVTAVILLVYLFIVGFTPSLFRAVILFIVISISLVWNRKIGGINALSLAFIICVFFVPASAVSLSFILSFTALAGIFTLGPVINRKINKFLPEKTALAISSSVGAQAGTLPVVYFYFQTFYPAGIIISLIIVPLVTFFMWTALFALIFKCFGALSIFILLTKVMEICYTLILQIAEIGSFFIWK